MTVKYYDGDLFTAPIDVLAHQCNVMSRGAAGLAGVIFGRWPQCNTYKENPEPRRYRHFTIHQVPTTKDCSIGQVVNLYTQMYPGKPTWGLDSVEQRLEIFEFTLSRLCNYYSTMGQARDYPYIIGLPHFIGCALAGGDWDDYSRAIESVAEIHQGNNVELHVVKKV